MAVGAFRPLKTSEKIALDIVRSIVERRLNFGDPLPNEAEMTRQYNASRASVREALRLLEVQGLIQIKRGSHIGTTVGEAHAAALARALTLYFHLAGVTYDELFETWQLTEPLLAESAARNKDRDAVEQRIANHLSVDGLNWEAVVDFHDAIFDLAGNRALAFIVRAVGMLCATVVRELDLSTYHDIQEDYAKIAKAILDGDTARARETMLQNILRVTDRFRKEFPEKVGDRVTSPELSQLTA